MIQRIKKALIWAALIAASLALLLTIRIQTWGNPVPVVYRLTGTTSENPGGDRSWTYQRSSDGRTFVATDSDGDGTVDSVLAEGSSPIGFDRPEPATEETHRLILCLDGIPYQEIISLWEEGYFREFFRPVPLISPFPSESEVALTESVHAGPVPGYEHKFYDRGANRVRGGIWTTFRETNIPYLEVFDYDMGGIFKGIAYIIPLRSYRADLGRMRTRFLKSESPVYVAHVASVDSLYHIKTRLEMRELLKETDTLLRDLYYGAEGRLRITVYADHGNSLVDSYSVALPGHLEKNGWRLTNSLQRENDVVVPAYGLIAFSAVYVQPGKAAELAPVLAELEGVDLVVRPGNAQVEIVNRHGNATIEWRNGGTEFRYVVDTADALELSGVIAALQTSGKVMEGGWVTDQNLFLATLDHRYPDVAYRLRQVTINHVKNRADLMISYLPGYFYGSGIFAEMTDIYSTHGALDRMQTLGFAMSTDGPLNRTIRSGELLHPNFRRGAATKPSKK